MRVFSKFAFISVRIFQTVVRYSAFNPKTQIHGQ